MQTRNRRRSALKAKDKNKYINVVITQVRLALMDDVI